MPLFEVDAGRPVLVRPTGPVAGFPDAQRVLDANLQGLLGEQIFPVSQGRGDGEPYLLALDASGHPVVIEVVAELTNDDLSAALNNAGAASRLTRAQVAAKYAGGASDFGRDFSVFRESVALVHQGRSGAARLIVICQAASPDVLDAVHFLRQPGSHVSVLQLVVMQGDDGRTFVNVAPLVVSFDGLDGTALNGAALNGAVRGGAVHEATAGDGRHDGAAGNAAAPNPAAFGPATSPAAFSNDAAPAHRASLDDGDVTQALTGKLPVVARPSRRVTTFVSRAERRRLAQQEQAHRHLEARSAQQADPQARPDPDGLETGPVASVPLPASGEPLPAGPTDELGFGRTATGAHDLLPDAAASFPYDDAPSAAPGSAASDLRNGAYPRPYDDESSARYRPTRDGGLSDLPDAAPSGMSGTPALGWVNDAGGGESSTAELPEAGLAETLPREIGYSAFDDGDAPRGLGPHAELVWRSLEGPARVAAGLVSEAGWETTAGLPRLGTDDTGRIPGDSGRIPGDSAPQTGDATAGPFPGYGTRTAVLTRESIHTRESLHTRESFMTGHLDDFMGAAGAQTSADLFAEAAAHAASAQATATGAFDAGAFDAGAFDAGAPEASGQELQVRPDPNAGPEPLSEDDDPDLIDLAGRIGSPTPLVWSRPRRRQRFEAVLHPDGYIELDDGGRFRHPDLAASAASGTVSVSGWEVWRLGDSGPTLTDLFRSYHHG